MNCRLTRKKRIGVRLRRFTSWCVPLPGRRCRRPARRVCAAMRPRCNISGAVRARFPASRRCARKSRRCSSKRSGIDGQCDRAAWCDNLRICRGSGEADFNVVLYPEIAGVAASLVSAAQFWAEERRKSFRSAYGATDAISSPRWRGSPGSMPAPVLKRDSRVQSSLVLRAPSTRTYLTNKRVFIFGDATHAIACAARVARARKWG